MSDLPDKQPMVDAYAKFHDIAERVSARDPADVIARHQLALADQKVGEGKAALHHYDLALVDYLRARDAQLAIAAHDPADQNTRNDLAASWRDIGQAKQQLGDTAAAVNAFRAALALRQSFLKQAPHAPILRHDMAEAQDDLADVLTDANEACRLRRAGDAIWRQLDHEGKIASTDRDEVDADYRKAAACH